MASQPRRPVAAVLLAIPFVISVLAIAFNVHATARVLFAQQQRQIDAVPSAHGEAVRKVHDAALRAVPLCARDSPRAQSFVLLFMGHSGSTALISALAQHPQVLVRGFEPVDHGTLVNDIDGALEYADRFFTEGAASNTTAGFKLRPRHVLRAPKRWAALFRKHNTRIVWNYRANVFKQAVGHYPIVYLNDLSRYEGLAVGAKNDTSSRRRRVTRFRIHDMSALHSLLASRLRGEAEVERALGSLGSHSCVLPLSYKMLLKQPEHAQLAMQAFLGIDLDRSLRAARRKATGDNLCDVVTNWPQVCDAFFGCHRWRGMMDDLDNGCTCPVATGSQQMRDGIFCSDRVTPTSRAETGSSGRRKAKKKEGKGHRVEEERKKEMYIMEGSSKKVAGTKDRATDRNMTKQQSSVSNASTSDPERRRLRTPITRPMDIDTASPAMHLELPSDEVMMEVEDFNAAAAPPPVVTPVVHRPVDGASPSLRSVPTPPSVQITTSDTASCPKAKLDELFVRYLTSPESQVFLNALLEDVRAGKDISNSPAYRRLQHADRAVHSSAAAQLPGSPVSRLIHTHSPFGEMSPRSPSVAASIRGVSPAPLNSEIDLGRTSDPRSNVTVSTDETLASRSILTSQPLTTSDFHSAAKTAEFVDKHAMQTAVGDRQVVSPQTINAVPAIDTDAVQQKVASGVISDSKETSSPTSVDVNMSSDTSEDTTVQPKSTLAGKQEDTPMLPADSKMANGIGEDSDLEKRKQEAVLSEQSPGSSANLVAGVSGHSTPKRTLSPGRKEPVSQELQSSTISTQDVSASAEQSGSGSRPPCPVPSISSATDARMADTGVSDAQNIQGAIPRFYFPCGRDAAEREKKERDTILEFFSVQRSIDGATKSDIAGLVVEVVGVPSYFASLIFNRIAKWYPYSAEQSQALEYVPGTPEPMSADSMRSGAVDATMRDTSTVPNGDSTDAANTQMEAPGSTQAQNQAGANAQQSSNANNASFSAQGGTTENGASTSNGAPGRAPASVEFIREEQFQKFYDKDCAGKSKDERLFRVLLEPNADRDYLIPVDFKPLLRALLVCHQGLAFLHATPEFQHRYSETVIERIYFGCTRRHNGRLTLSDIKRSRLLETLMVVDEEEDINRERKYFSYEHFYVLYCRFWELDTNHDLQIDREDLMRYGGHSLTFRIVDRIFGGHARPLDGAENPGFMSYTDFIWFCLSEEDKTSETAIDYWFRCVDLDGDGLITMYDMEFFYQEQLHRMECFGHEPVAIRDILCQLLDMIKPNAKPPVIRRRDLKKCKLSGNFFNILFNLNKFFQLEARDPLQIRQEHATPELTDWDRFAAIEYLRLSAEEEGEEDEGWDDGADNSTPLIAGEAPF